MTSERLKNLSKPFHDTLESHLINQNLFSQSATVSDYYRFLSLQYIVFTALEDKIQPFLSRFSEYAIVYVSRASQAKQELVACGIPLPKISFDASFITDFSSALASLYLLEGSRHGAMVILKSIRSFMPSDYNFLFLETNPSDFIQQWKNITSAMQSYSTTKKLHNKLVLDVCKLYLEIEGFYNDF